MTRSPGLQNFLDATRDTFAKSGANRQALSVSEKIFEAANATVGQAISPEPTKLPACRYLEDALDLARSEGGPVSNLATTLGKISSRLMWVTRPNGENDEPVFKMNHANAVVVGEGGLEARSDIRIGMSLLAPQTRYPDHQHPPEEIYTVLSCGEWKQGPDGEFFSPGVGGFVHNVPYIVHGMRSGKFPLLAVWSLWIGN